MILSGGFCYRPCKIYSNNKGKSVNLLIIRIDMKRRIALNSLQLLLLLSCNGFFVSCVKSGNSDTVNPTELIPTVLISEGGLINFSSQAIVLDAAAADTFSFRISYQASNVAPNDITLNLGYDATALIAYNTANPKPSNPYTKFPDSIYKFTQTQVTIKSGQLYSEPIKLIVYPNKIKRTKNYMLPISITGASGVNINGNFGTIYYHLLGNPFAGDYHDNGVRYDYLGQVSWAGPTMNPVPPGATLIRTYNYNVPAIIVDSQTIQLPMGDIRDPDGNQSYYTVVTLSPPPLSTITYHLSYSFISGNSHIQLYLLSYTPPSPTQKASFRFVVHYNNMIGGSGNDRIVDETFTQL